ncbi:MAG: hypothetical protein GDA43_13220 [Hormoscilla sp. SP5CHS1]|nr:hypothetical protein [Hormoscilla sp. SP12CHS1]MBC6454032.1 hypothetical protein [Hormoscilla sp. SP5CHS1]
MQTTSSQAWICLTLGKFLRADTTSQLALQIPQIPHPIAPTTGSDVLSTATEQTLKRLLRKAYRQTLKRLLRTASAF